MDTERMLSVLINWSWPEVDHLEVDEQYKAACDLMYNKWWEEPENLKVFLRLSFSCWYVITEYEVLRNVDLEREELVDFESLLDELTMYGLREFQDAPDFLWIYGYMISLFPENFNESTDKEMGKFLIEEALNLRPEDPVIQLVYNDNFAGRKQNLAYEELCTTVRCLLRERFSGEGELQRYFRKVLERGII